MSVYGARRPGGTVAPHVAQQLVSCRERVYGLPRSANPDPKLAAVLKRLREDRGLSQEHVAWNASLSVSTLAKIEYAQTAPHWDSVMRILAALEVTLAELAAALDAEHE